MLVIIALTGLARSGKDTAAKYISEKYGFKWFDFSRDALEQELRVRNLPITKENMSSLGDELRKKYGTDILAQKLVEKIKQSNAENVVVSGVRSPEEAGCLKRSAEKFILIKIIADPKKRIQRAGNAGIVARDEQDIKKKGMSKVLDMADVIIENNGTLDELHQKIDAVLLQSQNVQESI